ncbi:hypothetical protein ACP70R_013601 [Stipagrostis hirtigluma subsp. patula]
MGRQRTLGAGPRMEVEAGLRMRPQAAGGRANGAVACPTSSPGCPYMASAPVSAPDDATLGRHLARRLVQVGVSDVVAVPGDFNRILHHTIGLHDFSQELRCFQPVTCHQAIVNNLDDAHGQIDRAISTALRESKPRAATSPASRTRPFPATPCPSSSPRG